MESYCVKCKSHKEIANPKFLNLGQGKKVVSGECPTCGTKMFKLFKIEAPRTDILVQKDEELNVDQYSFEKTHDELLNQIKADEQAQKLYSSLAKAIKSYNNLSDEGKLEFVNQIGDDAINKDFRTEILFDALLVSVINGSGEDDAIIRMETADKICNDYKQDIGKQNVILYYEEGKRLLKLGAIDSAFDEFEKVAASIPDFYKTYFWLYVCKNESKEPELANEYLTILDKLNPEIYKILKKNEN